MRAIVVRDPGAADALQLEDVPLPPIGTHDVLIEVEACGVCFHDVVVRNGTLKRGVQIPVIPGHEVSGRVRQVGAEVRLFKTGDRVTTVQRSHVCGQCRYCRTDRESACAERVMLGDVGLNGGYSEFVAVEEDNIALVPDEVPLDHAAIIACAIGTQLNAIRDVAEVRAGDRVLITGAGGGLGIHGVQIARFAGAEVIAVTTSPQKAEEIKRAGAHHVIVAERGGDFSADVRAITGSEGVDVAIDNVGSATFTSTRRSLGMGGRWIMVGQLSGEFVKLNPAQIFLQDLTIRSAKATSRRQLVDAIELVRRGAVKPMISASLPLDEAAHAHRLMESAAPTGRILLKPSLRSSTPIA
ncbi:alcohol dehydrogenase catalytic domain-containing protein [Chelatococcus asaccharovorans]|uniref:alcohol dehydrogenase catalytic domain-containing protein n=1 Tax=Chelatococcus asaccharovorans TaxID=28210 RepID=UPI0014757AC6|nr:alcohol dehydrogenase catalytic domain-containing protein [Chelatococcus asaccharovorans]MBS7707965.1 alcohol dehydrogenase catalytic domain-containing protein [Chelatococcus asaccharovorans]